MTHFDENRIAACADANRGEVAEALEVLQELAPDIYRRATGAEGDRAAVIAEHMMRVALCQIITPPRGGSCQLEAEIVALAIGLPGMGSLQDIARKYGLGRAAISKRVTRLAELMELPPSIYMRGEKSRKSYKRSNAKRRHF
jgi:hypothetical protein